MPNNPQIHSQLKIQLMNGTSSPNTNLSPSLYSRLMSYVCPCLFSPSTGDVMTDQATLRHEESKEDVNGRGRGEVVNTVEELTGGEGRGIEGEGRGIYGLSKSLYEIGNKYEDERGMGQSDVKIWHSYPVSLLKQGQFLVLGSAEHKLLCKASSTKLQPSPTTLHLTSRSFRPPAPPNPTNLDKYWHLRYHLFQNFDDGISINQPSWPHILPQAIADHLASRIKCQRVVCMHGGVGELGLKLSYNCGKVWVVDHCQATVNCMYVNVRVCGLGNVAAEGLDWGRVRGWDPQVLVLTGVDQGKGRVGVVGMGQQEFGDSVRRALAVCSNLVLVLPANVDIDAVTSLLAQSLASASPNTQTCSIKIEKLFYNSQLTHVAIYYGTLVNTSATLNDELLWVYGKLGDKQNASKVKKIVKKLRTRYGMNKLLDIVVNCSNMQGSSTQFEKFMSLIQEQNLMTEQELIKMLSHVGMKRQADTTDSPNQADTEQQDQSEKTLSYISSVPEQQIRLSLEQAALDCSIYRSISMPRQSMGTATLHALPRPCSEDRRSDVVEFMPLQPPLSLPLQQPK